MIKFNHEEITMGQSLGLNKDKETEITASVIFEIMNQEFMIFKLYDNVDDAPRNLKTKTGVLECIFDNIYVTNEKERLFAMWEYAKIDLTLSGNSKESEALNKISSLIFTKSQGNKQNFIEYFKKIRD